MPEESDCWPASRVGEEKKRAEVASPIPEHSVRAKLAAARSLTTPWEERGPDLETRTELENHQYWVLGGRKNEVKEASNIRKQVDQQSENMIGQTLQAWVANKYLRSHQGKILWNAGWKTRERL